MNLLLSSDSWLPLAEGAGGLVSVVVLIVWAIVAAIGKRNEEKEEQEEKEPGERRPPPRRTGGSEPDLAEEMRKFLQEAQRKRTTPPPLPAPTRQPQRAVPPPIPTRGTRQAPAPQQRSTTPQHQSPSRPQRSTVPQHQSPTRSQRALPEQRTTPQRTVTMRQMPARERPLDTEPPVDEEAEAIAAHDDTMRALHSHRHDAVPHVSPPPYRFNRALLGSRDGLKHAFVLTEILGKPRALREFGQG